MQKLQNYVNGELVPPNDNQYINQYIDNINPSIGEVYSLIPNSNQKDV